MSGFGSTPWVKSRLSSLPAHKRALSPSALGGAGQSCLLRHALTALDAAFAKYSPPSYFSSWGTIYHALREKAFSREEYDAILRHQLAVEDEKNSKDWLRRRLVPLAGIPFIRDKLAIDSKLNYSKLPLARSPKGDKSQAGAGAQNFEYLREKFLPEKNTASTLPFRGRIDCLIRWPDGTYVIRDYKTGSIYEHKTRIIKSAYVRQLHAYALLTHEAYGILPKGLELVDETGRIQRVPYDDATAAMVLAEAKNLIASLDEALRCFASDRSAANYALPSTENCQYCQVKPYCPSYWKTGTVPSGDFSFDIKSTVASRFDGYSPAGKRADLTLCVGEGRFVSLLVPMGCVDFHPVLTDWVAGAVPVGSTIYVISAGRTVSPTQFIVKDDTVICTDGY